MKIVLPVLPGSTTDIMARLVADQLSQKWGKPVIVENMPGAAMNIGSEYVAHADPDGYTLLLCPPSPLSIQQLLYHDLKYDPTKFVPIVLLAKIANVLAVRPDFPAASVQDLIAYGKANPGKLTFASQGVGSTAHLSGSELEVLGGIKMVHVPYHGAQPALTDVMASNVDMFFDTLTTSVPLYRAGKLKLLGVASAERSKDVPEIPTIAESGLPGFRSITWFAIAAPPGTPAPLAGKDQPRYRRYLAEAGSHREDPVVAPRSHGRHDCGHGKVRRRRNGIVESRHHGGAYHVGLNPRPIKLPAQAAIKASQMAFQLAIRIGGAIPCASSVALSFAILLWCPAMVQAADSASAALQCKFRRRGCKIRPPLPKPRRSIRA